ncbi:hypothetical protein K439DRAFT_1616347 [Ramaria rubella]|nr:hypothetical protein K439DRAFT_1616347 [Ramaria rubella]
MPPWDPLICHGFNKIRESTTDESEWYGPWNMLLTHLFPYMAGLQVSPQHMLAGSLQAPEWTLVYFIAIEGIPLCVFEVKPAGHLHQLVRRQEAENQIYSHLDTLRRDTAQVPTIYGISCLGKSFVIYELDTGTNVITPARPTLQRGSGVVEYGPPPPTWWNMGVLTAQGQLRLEGLRDKIDKLVEGKETRVLAGDDNEEIHSRDVNLDSPERYQPRPMRHRRTNNAASP